MPPQAPANLDNFIGSTTVVKQNNNTIIVASDIEIFFPKVDYMFLSVINFLFLCNVEALRAYAYWLSAGAYTK